MFEHQKEFFDFFEDNKLPIIDYGNGYIEKEKVFDKAQGRHSMCDLCFPSSLGKFGLATISIEAKVDEKFGSKTIEKYYTSAQIEKETTRPTTEKLKRIEAIYKTITGRKYEEESEMKNQFNQLRFQLFSGLLGCIAESQRSSGVEYAIFIVHCFKTNLYNQREGKRNKAALDEFLGFFGIAKPIISGQIVPLELHLHKSTEFALLDAPLKNRVYVGFLETEL
jgi:hypothetical protein